MITEEMYRQHPEMRQWVWNGGDAASQQTAQLEPPVEPKEGEIVALRREIAALRKEVHGLREFRIAATKNFEVLAGEKGGVLDLLLDRIEMLEKRPSVQYRGTYVEGVPYEAGDMVTFGGSIWHCNVANCGVKPRDGAADGFWQLAVRAGRDGKDAGK